jgi:hypothetical protein
MKNNYRSCSDWAQPKNENLLVNNSRKEDLRCKRFQKLANLLLFASVLSLSPK